MVQTLSPRVDYSLLIVVAAGMMKMATGDDLSPPPGRVPERGLVVFGGYRALRGRNF